MARTLTVSVEEMVPEFIQLAKQGNSGMILSTTMRTLEWLSTKYQEAWQAAASGAGSLPGLPFILNSREYHRTIERRQISPTAWEIYTSYTTRTGLSVTELLERGHGLIDLKPGLLSGPKSKQGKKGRYNVVAFRPGTPNTQRNPMPMSVYKAFSAQIKAADARKRSGASPTGGASYTSKSSAAPGGREYAWGTRFDRKSKQGMLKKTITKGGKKVGEYQQRAGRYAGMVAMQASTQAAKSSSYLTFRIVSAASDPMSWIVPEQPPWPIRKAITDYMRPFAEAQLQRALEQDIK